LSKHWKLAAGFAVGVILIVTATTLLMRPVYEPEGRLQIDPPGNEVFSLETSAGGNTDAQYIATEAQKLQTAELALALVRELHLDENPEMAGKAARHGTGNDGMTPAERAAVHSVRSQLFVHRDPGSRLVAVRFASYDPVVSAAVVNTIMKLFVQASYQARHESIMQSSNWLARQLDDIREKMERSSRDFASYQRRHNVAEVDQNSNTVSERIAELNKQLGIAQAERIELEAYLRGHKNNDSLPQAGANPVVQVLRQKQAELKAASAEASVIYGPTHPTVRKLQSQVAELERQLRDRTNGIMSELETRYAAAQAREMMLVREVKNATQELSNMEQYTNLKKEADVDRQLYNSLYAKVKEAGISAASKSSNIRVVEQAAVLDRPTRPHRLFNLLAALIFGVVGGISLAFVKEGMDDRIHTTQDMRHWTGLRSVAAIPELSAPSLGMLLLPRARNGNGSVPAGRLRMERPNSPESEALNGLRTSLLFSRMDNPPRVLLVTSPLPGEGKTTVATNLAVALAKRATTCLVDADLRRPGTLAIFNLPNLAPGKGLAHLLRGVATLEEALHPVSSVDRLSILPSWRSEEDAAELLNPTKVAELIALLRQRFEFVVLDTPPILPYADGRVLSALVDGVVLVGRATVTPGSAMLRTLELLAEVHSAPVLTVVLNAADFRSPEYNYYSAHR
jgi:capsular exopolysaccharide synthesis family protein